MKSFYQVLINTLIANITTSYLWFALVFWVYLETKSVLATGIIGGLYMLLVAICSIWFGTVVDRHKKRSVMLFASSFTAVAFLVASLVYIFVPNEIMLELTQPWFWLFAGIVLIGAVVENMRNIALSTVVTLLVEKDRRANANGLVGTVQGIGFIITSVFSGLSIGLLGMGWTLAIACTLTAFMVAPLAQFIVIPFMKSDAGSAQFGWLIGAGEARGIALIFLVSGLIMVVVALLAFATKTYRHISSSFAKV